MRGRKHAANRVFSGVFNGFIFAFLYLPIAIVILFSFNTSKRNIVFEGFTFEWYAKLFQNDGLLQAYGNTLIVGFSSTIVATIVGTLASYGMSKYKFKGKGIIDTLLYIPVVIPEIVLGISLLAIFNLSKIPMGIPSLIIAHATFCIPFVVFTVNARFAGFDKSIEEAAMDLGAGRVKTFLTVTLPNIMPGVVSGAFLSFTLSIDDIIISFFTTGPGSNTYPLKVMELTKTGITPDVYALSTIVLVITIGLVILTQRDSKGKKSRK
ncbi:MAG: Ornithine carbamoyltransferase [Herbinix sp.]|jgi:spermidine/putrescine transport system permease protein|nr:Ornithine carbamoyltransferase [Herbinix sp.]